MIDILLLLIIVACAVAALKCYGKSTVHDEAILERWPHFKTLIDKLCTYQTQT